MSDRIDDTKRRATTVGAKQKEQSIDIEERKKVVAEAKQLIANNFDGRLSKAINAFQIEKNIQGSRKSSIYKMLGNATYLETARPAAWGTLVDFVEFVREKGSRSIANTFDADQIQDVFSSLGPNDTITIISADGFIEAHEIQFRQHVISNLISGCTYNYVFPTKRLLSSKNDFVQLWEDICRSSLLDKSIASVDIYGVGISPDTFEYFSPISRIVIHERANDSGVSSSTAYSFVRIKSNSGETTLWYVLPDSTKDKILDRLESSTKSTANYCVTFPEHVYAANTMQSEYASAFRNREFCEEYRKLAKFIRNKHLIPKILEAFSSRYRSHPHEEGTFDWLDLGCGDGHVALEIAEMLKVRNRRIRLVGLDYSRTQIDSFRDSISGVPLEVEARIDDANTASLGGRYDLITIIHSIYALDHNVLYRLNNHLKPNGVCLIYMANPDKSSHSFAALQAKATNQAPSLLSNPKMLLRKLRNIRSRDLQLIPVPTATITVDTTIIPNIAGFFALTPANDTSVYAREEVRKMVSNTGFRVEIDDCIISFTGSEPLD